jgi:hypothetical protein
MSSSIELSFAASKRISKMDSRKRNTNNKKENKNGDGYTTEVTRRKTRMAMGIRRGKKEEQVTRNIWFLCRVN